MTNIELDQQVKFRPGLRPAGLSHLPEWGTVESIDYAYPAGPRVEVSFYDDDSNDIVSVVAPESWLDNELDDPDYIPTDVFNNVPEPDATPITHTVTLPAHQWTWLRAYVQDAAERVFDGEQFRCLVALADQLPLTPTEVED